jgi:hypothetical protein
VKRRLPLALPPRLSLPLPLIGAILVYLLLRSLILHSSFDAVCVANYEVGAMGNIAKIRVEGIGAVPLYRFYDNCGGHLMTGLFAAPLYALFGDSYLSLKLVPLLLGLGTMVLMWWILARHFSRGAANVAALLFACTPATLTKFSVVAMGSHFESLFFQLIVLALFLRIHCEGRGERSGPWYLGLGLAAGFCTFFYFGSGVILAVLALVHLTLRGLRRALRDLVWVLPGFVLGVSPLIWINVKTSGRASSFLDAKFQGGEHSALGRWSARTEHFFRDVLPRAGAFEDLGPIPGRVAEWALIACLAAAWIWLGLEWLRKRGDRTDPFQRLKSAPLLLYFPLLVVFIGATTIEFKPYAAPVEAAEFRYLVPHFTYGAMLIGVAVASLRARGGPAALAGTSLATVALATGLFCLPIVDWSFARTGLGRHYDGFHFKQYGRFVLTQAERAGPDGRPRADGELLATWLTELPPTMRGDAAIGVAHLITWREVAIEMQRSGGENLELNLLELLAPHTEAVHIDLARGVGSFLRKLTVSSKGQRERVRALLERLAARDHPMNAFVAEGLCVDFGYALERKTRDMLDHSAEMEGVVPAVLSSSWRRGQGMHCGRLLRRGLPTDVERVLALAGTIPEPGRPEFWMGVGWGLADAGVETGWLARFEAWVPPEHRRSAFGGCGAALRHVYGKDESARLARPLRGALRAEELAALERGLRWRNYPSSLGLR